MRRLAATLAGALLLGTLVGAPATPAAAGTGLILDKRAPAEILLGEDVDYELAATNTSALPQYNLSFSDILPPGLKYKPGSAKPAVGEPKITSRADGRQVLTWVNVADLQANADFTLSFAAEYVLPVEALLGPVLTNDGNAATSDDPRDVPGFNSDGQPTGVSNQASAQVNTNEIGVEIEKSEPSPEDELLRGVHDHRTVYTLVVRNNKIAPTNTVTVNDYLPVGLEFLGCGTTDNTSPGFTPEYPGAPALGVPAMTIGPDCLTPDLVDTVLNPNPPGPTPVLNGPYTQVQWQLNDLQPGQTVTIKYAAGIPLQANTDTWPGARPTPASGNQGSNLDNNNGPSTREVLTEDAFTNFGVVDGFFQSINGPVQTADETTETVFAEDVRMRKTASTSTFAPGDIVTFSFPIETSEYMDAADIVVTDLLPDGYCPLGSANYYPGTAACAPVAGVGPTIAGTPVDYSSVTWNNSLYEIVFPKTPNLTNNDSVLVTMPARMLDTYRETGQPTVAGDGFTNRVQLGATTTPIPAVVPIESGQQQVQDTSRESQTTPLPVIDKTMKPRTVPMDCAALDNPPYANPQSLSDAERTFRKGDIMCFKLRARFPDIKTKNAYISDFVPFGTTYLAGSAQPTVNNTATIAGTDFSADPLTWTLGDKVGNDYFVAANAVFEVTLAVTVQQPSAGPLPDLTGNLMKMRTINTAGLAESYRDQADFNLAPPPNLAIKKGVAKTTAPANTFDPPQDNKPVQEGSVATFQVDLTNKPRPEAPGTEFSARGLQVWDVLPIETPVIDCAAVSNYRFVKPGTNIVVPFDLSKNLVGCAPSAVTGSVDPRATIKWTLPDPDGPNDFSIPSGETLSLLYDVQIPPKVAVSTKWNNTAHVRSFAAYTNTVNVTTTYYPQNNIDPTVTKPMWDAPQLRDPSSIFINNATVGKTGVTALNEENNNTPNQATIGETVQYTYTVTVPAGSVIYKGILSDTLPAGFDFVSADDWGLRGTPDTKPAGFTLDPTNGTLTFPDEWDNSDSTPDVFFVKATAKVAKSADPCATETATVPCVVPPSPANNLAKVNTARFVSQDGNGKNLPPRTRTYTVNVMQPAPRIEKTANPEVVAQIGDPVTYTLKASTPSGRPPLHGSLALDCIPKELEAITITPATPDAKVIDATDPAFMCADPGNYPQAILWDTKTLAPGSPKVLTYTAKVKAGSPASSDFINTVTLSGTSMPGAVDGERTYSTGAQASIISPGGAIEKSTTPSRATIGQTVTSTIRVNLDALEYPNLSVLDTLPPYIDEATVTTVSTVCTIISTGQPCSAALTSSLLGPDPASPGATGQNIAWAFDALPDSGSQRTIAITYLAMVNDVPGNVAGQTRTNTAQAFWGGSSKPSSIPQVTSLPNKSAQVSDTFAVIEPEVVISKSVDDQAEITVVPGQEFTYKVTVTNPDRLVSGQSYGSTAYGLEILDILPAGVVPSNISDGGQYANGAITWELASLDVNASKTFTYKAKLVPPPSLAPEVNTVQVTEFASLPADPNNPNIRDYASNKAQAKVQPVLPDPKIEKFASDAWAYIDKPYTWQLQISNPSGAVTPGATAYQVGATDVLPPNWEYVPGTTSITLDGKDVSKEPASVSGQPQTIRWPAIGDLPADGLIVLEFQAKPTSAVRTDPGVGAAIPHVNTATTDWQVGPPAENWGTTTSDPVTAQTKIGEADLQIVKSHETNYTPPPAIGKGEVVPGTSFVWQMDVSNNGPDPSFGPYKVVDTLPVGVTYQSVTSPEWTCSAAAQVVTCTHPDLPDGLASSQALPRLKLVVNVAPGVTGDLKNTATVTGETLDPDPTNNTSEDTVKARPLADLVMVKTSSKPYIVGNQVTYTLAVTNLGPSVAKAPITVTDTLPAGLSIASIDAGPWVCSPTSGETAQVSCTLNSDLAANSQAPLIKVTVDVLESPGKDAQNCAVAGSPTEDPVIDNNTGCVTDPVVSDVQLGITKKTTGANPVTAGESTQFTITVTNAGPAKAKNVKVVDVLEPGLTATAATGSGWACDVGTGSAVTCTRANFAVKDSPSDIVVTAKVAASVPGGSTLKNTATVTTTSPQPGGDPPPAISTVDVVAKSDLSIDKWHTKQPWTVGKTGQWYLTVTNNGQSDNPGPITVTDQLPVGTTFGSASGTGWDCQPGAERAFTCTTASPLVVGQTSSIVTVTVNVVTGAAPSVLNTATVTSPIPDSNPDNNTDTDRVPVERAKQTAEKLPPSPERIKSGRTDQGQKIRTRVRCTPKRSSAAGEVSFCKVTRKNGVIRVRVKGSEPMRVTVTQFASGTSDYKPWKRVKRYVVRPGRG